MIGILGGFKGVPGGFMIWALFSCKATLELVLRVWICLRLRSSELCQVLYKHHKSVLQALWAFLCIISHESDLLKAL